MIKNYFLVVLCFSLSQHVFAQDLSKMNAWQDSLMKVGQRMYQSRGEAERLESNFSFVKTLVSSLKEADSYRYPFEKLKMISILSPEDGSFRVFSWNIPLQDGSYLYYGAVQMKSNSLKLIPLLDKTFEIKGPEEAVVKSSTWYGAQYYAIVSLSKNRYALLGWKGHHAEYSKKVIEVMDILPNGEIQFGAAVFADNPKTKRKIFSYTRQATMMLRYNKEAKQIEMDHIAPASVDLKGNYKYYGPDMSYDVYNVQEGKLKLRENVVLQNPENVKDKDFIDPKRSNSLLKSGF